MRLSHLFSSLCCLLLCFMHPVSSQTITVNPYLQDASPDQMTIMWETNSNSATQVEWGLTSALGNSSNGTSATGFGSSQIHTVHLTDLQPATRYYYRAVTAGTASAIFDFKTPPLQSAEESFNIVAMSDMQRDFTQPNKFQEIVHDGVLDYVNDNYGSDLPEHLDVVLIPGDLVVNGFDFASWEREFFDPAHPLLAHVPLYPVLGNHELNTPYYFSYFHLPNNGTAGFEEHWWYKDYSNVRIIGLDSNTGFTVQDQLDWLANVLNQTCTDTLIDFVFAQLHHPHHSELWLAGESNFTGDVIFLLENFSTNCNKPSIHFFGHTHGYSRGQSQDHNHLMVNVASAGGSIDEWGEFAQNDYEEYTVSQAEYGFVFMEVEAGADPKFVLKRISRGNTTVSKDNVATDSIAIRKNNLAPRQPQHLFPLPGDTVNPDCLTLKASHYFDSDDDLQGAAQWQISTNCSDFSNPVYDQWRNHENWYFDTNTQQGDDLSDEQISGLSAGTEYCWRVRYRDRGLGWSPWSRPVHFFTSDAPGNLNLLANPGAEQGTNNWFTTAGAVESIEDGECGGIDAYRGNRLFAVGGVCNNNAYGEGYQQVDVSGFTSDIDAGIAIANYGGHLSNWGGSDVPAIALEFRDQNMNLLTATPTTSNFNDSWTLYDLQAAIPAMTRFIRYRIMGTRNSGSDNDSYFDELFLKVIVGVEPCPEYIPCEAEKPFVTIESKVFLQGPYDSLSGLMHDSLRKKALLPLTEPYSALGWSQFGVCADIDLKMGLRSLSGENALVDWIILELRDPNDSSVVLSSIPALVQRNGQVVNPQGGTDLSFYDQIPGEYYLAVRHRNHLGAMTANPIQLTETTSLVDFTSPNFDAYGTDAQRYSNGVHMLWAGDVVKNGTIQYAGIGNDRDPILSSIGGLVPTNIFDCYCSEDNNLDGLVRFMGLANDQDVILQNIGGTVPTEVRKEQLPD